MTRGSRASSACADAQPPKDMPVSAQRDVSTQQALDNAAAEVREVQAAKEKASQAAAEEVKELRATNKAALDAVQKDVVELRATGTELRVRAEELLRLAQEVNLL